MIRRRLFALALVLVAPMACWSIGAELDVSGRNVSTSVDASDAAAWDAMTADGTGPGAVDGGSTRADSGSPSSDGNVLFAEAFDDRAIDPLARFVRIGAGSLTLDETDFVSAPRSARAVALGTDGNHPALSISVPVTAPGVRIMFAAKVVPPSGGFDEIDPAFLRVTPPPTGSTSLFYAHACYPSKVEFESNRASSDGGGALDGKPITFAFNTWEQVQLTVEPDVVTAKVHGTTASYPVVFPITSVELVLGVPYASSAQGAVVHIDDVLVERLR